MAEPETKEETEDTETQETSEVTETQETDFLSMSDEDVMEMAEPEESEPTVESEPESEPEPKPEAEASAEPEEVAAEGDEPEAATDEGEKEDETEEGQTEEITDEKAENPEAETSSPEEAEADGDKGNKEKSELEAKKEDTTKDEDKATIDYEAEYKRLLAPFKANGREMSVKSVDDALALMQMGANYNKKMSGLKPNLKLLKMLDKNELLDEGKISYLIDLANKDPAAINKLIKDSGIDPMDLDAEKAGEYKQTTRTVNDSEIELDTVLDEIKDSPAYTRTLAIVGNQWDAASKQIVADNPHLLRIINSQVESGIYDKISAEVDLERTLGRLNGLSDLHAYKEIGDKLEAAGAFAPVKENTSPSTKESKPEPKVIVPKPKQVDDQKLKEKRRAASSTKPAASGTKPEFNPLAMSDEEFSKIADKQLM